MKPKILAFVALAVVMAAVFVRLGFWQLDRLSERRALNAQTSATLALPEIPYQKLRASGAPWNRYAAVEGTPDYEYEFVYTGRSRNGSPGVHIFTPIRVEGSDRAVLVNRGWVYAADAATVDLTKWRESRRVFRGYTRQIPWGHTVAEIKGRSLRALLYNGVLRLVPYPVEGVYLVSQDSAGEEIPARLPPPDLSEGPHLSYAIQWFCFAATALIGAAVVTRRARRATTAGPSGA